MMKLLELIETHCVVFRSCVQQGLVMHLQPLTGEHTQLRRSECMLGVYGLACHVQPAHQQLLPVSARANGTCVSSANMHQVQLHVMNNSWLLTLWLCGRSL